MFFNIHDKTINLLRVKNSDPQLRLWMRRHYSLPGGFVGRSICYLIFCKGQCYGGIAGGSATLHLPGRDEFFGITKASKKRLLQCIINNVFYHAEPINNRYPIRWQFTSKVLAVFRQRIVDDWLEDYKDTPIGFESLIELPRSGKIYCEDGWTEVGITEGNTCKRIGGVGTDSWGGKRVWNQEGILRPKRVFCRELI